MGRRDLDGIEEEDRWNGACEAYVMGRGRTRRGRENTKQERGLDSHAG